MLPIPPEQHTGAANILLAVGFVVAVGLPGACLGWRWGFLFGVTYVLVIAVGYMVFKSK